MIFRNLSRLNSLFRRLTSPPRRPRRRRRPAVSIEPLECRTMLSGAPVLVSFSHTEFTNAEVSGTLSNDQGADVRLGNLDVQFDTNNDGAADKLAITDSTGAFWTNIGPLSGSGTVTFQVRVGDFDGWSAWSPQSITLPNPPDFDSITYEAETLAELTGYIVNDNGLQNATVEIDLNSDGAADDYAITDSNGFFSIDFDAMSGEEMTVKLRVGDADGWSAWQTYTFTPYMTPPTITGIWLVNDTGASSTDKVTADATIAGSIAFAGDPSGVEIQIDLNGDGVADCTTTADANGNFTIDLAPYIGEGEVNTQIRAVAIVGLAQQLEGSWEPFSFTYDSQA